MDVAPPGPTSGTTALLSPRRPRARLLVVGLVGLVVLLALVAGELLDRNRYGATSAVALLPANPEGLHEVFNERQCRQLQGKTSVFQLMWMACSSPFAFQAEYEVFDAHQLSVDYGEYVDYPTTRSLPPGARLYLNCGHTKCIEGFDMLLVGRKGDGFWEIRASARSPAEEDAAAAFLIGLWNS